MNVIAGKYKGRKLVTLQGDNTRPTLTRVKEDVFNIINNYFIFDNKIVLDLFAGSGALGLETISRGVGYVVFNDTHKEARDVISTNLMGIDQSSYVVMDRDYLDLLNNFKDKCFDLIFVDPPYAKKEYYDSIFEAINKTNILNNFGILVCESNSLLNPIFTKNLVLLKYKKYTKTNLYIWRLEIE
ncbi:16S rRNA (guanine966-N2)-methyltransferase [Spiroplasma sp. TIUS-1]|uniref:16S rRNA (guanine(966)-N(2))-methyltransferase RsmD n=1 Tax=Spiroplasma sp. TIUS-1 TaxID=216963 RepID=UPI00139947F1|nr:16S rRNA (guanine(966)-N(2))-methyltransferase RsmD [Spiroplasma sp. TIUS-1]QHX35763.1 16S rRNA (guanine966-N2)-methyltransferase [Spiroplasma sp. TIUS-1]